MTQLLEIFSAFVAFILIIVGLKNMRFVLGGAGEGKLGHARFDRAILVAVLGEITHRKAAMAETFQALPQST